MLFSCKWCKFPSKKGLENENDGRRTNNDAGRKAYIILHKQNIYAVVGERAREVIDECVVLRVDHLSFYTI